MKQLLALAAVVALSTPVLAQNTQSQNQPGSQNQSTPQNSPAQDQGATPSRSSGSMAQSGTRQDRVSRLTNSFVRKAAISDMYEIEASKIAQDKAQSQDVKNFAARMIEDHQKTTNDLKGMAKDMDMPTQMDSRHRSLIGRLQKASSARFDRLYEGQQVRAHRQAVRLFRDYAHRGDNHDLQQWALKTVPTLEDHLRQAQGLGRASSTVGRR